MDSSAISSGGRALLRALAVVLVGLLAHGCAVPPQGPADLLAFAPADTCSAVVIDLQEVRGLPIFQTMAAQGRGLPPDFEAMDTVCFYWLAPDEAEHPALRQGGIALLAPGGRDTLLGRVRDPSPVRLAGLKAYSHGTAFTAFPRDRVALFGSTETAFRAMAEAYRRGRRTDLRDALGGLVPISPGHTAYGGFVKWDSELGPFPFAPLVGRVPWSGSIETGAMAVGLTEGVRLRAVLDLSTPGDAQLMLSLVTTAVEAARAKLRGQAKRDPLTAPAVYPVLAALDKLEPAAYESRLRIDFHLTDEEVSDLASALAVQTAAAWAAVDEPEAEDGDHLARALGSAHAHNVGLGIRMWRMAHDDAFPPDLAVVVADGHLASAAELADPRDRAPVVQEGSRLPSSYRYVGSIPSESPAGLIICYTRPGLYEGGRIVLTVDSTPAWVPEGELHDPAGRIRGSLAASWRWIEENWGGQLDAETAARLRAFYEVEG